MAVRHADATWEGTLKKGAGRMRLGSGLFDGPFTFASRFESGDGTNPEELIGGALAGCYSMFLSSLLTNNGAPPTRVRTQAEVHLGDGPTVTAIHLTTRALVPGIDEAKFHELAAEAKAKCPISKALGAVETISLDAALEA